MRSTRADGTDGVDTVVKPGGGLSQWMLPQCLRKCRVAIPLMIAFFAANFVTGIVNYVLDAVLAGPKDPPPEMFRVILSTVIASAWIKYFHSSNEVRETFIFP